MASNTEGKITKQMLKTRSGEFDIESIHSLILREQDISDLGCIGECLNLERLDLSRNSISKLFSLAGLSNISVLNLSANMISSLEGLQSLDGLRQLNLAGNLIGSVDNLRCLMNLEKLEDLRLKDSIQGISNPVCMNNTYRTDLLNVLPKLHVLDGERLHGRGSEVFKIFEEIEAALSGSRHSGGAMELSTPGPWVGSDFWKPPSEFEKTNLADAEQQLQEMLADCARVVQDADVKLNAMIKLPESGDG